MSADCWLCCLQTQTDQEGDTLLTEHGLDV